VGLGSKTKQQLIKTKKGLTMIFDELMDFVQADEEMGCMELEVDGFIRLKNIDGKKIFDINFWGRDNLYELVKRCLEEHRAKFSETYLPEIDAKQLHVEAEISCCFLSPLDDDIEYSNFNRDKDLGHLNFKEASCYIQIRRVKGMKVFEVCFYPSENEYEMIKSELELYDFSYSEIDWDELRVEVAVNLSFIDARSNAYV
jgi:hypothetical protein